MLEKLKQEVYDANIALVKAGLVVLTWGNASGFDPQSQLMVIKPSGVDYEKMQPSDMVVVDLNGKIIEGKLRPSSDTPTHLELYRQWNKMGIHAIIHTHSLNAVAWAQAKMPLPCYGTTHADVFYNNVPCTRVLKKIEVEKAYELETGKVICETFNKLKTDPLSCPGVLVANHGPFVWGVSLKKAVEAAITLETVAEMALKTQILNQNVLMPKYIKDKHYFRKHGKNAYYGQK